jgi:hypothetical protein
MSKYTIEIGTDILMHDGPVQCINTDRSCRITCAAVEISKVPSKNGDMCIDTVIMHCLPKPRIIKIHNGY